MLTIVCARIGIWMCKGKAMNVMVMDVEGTDGRERGEDQVGSGIRSRAQYCAVSIASVQFACGTRYACQDAIRCLLSEKNCACCIPRARTPCLVYVAMLCARMQTIRLSRAVFSAQRLLSTFILGLREEIRPLLSGVL